MKTRPAAFVLRDLLAILSVVALGSAAAALAAAAPQPHGPAPQTMANLHTIAVAAAQFQADHNNAPPMTLTYVRGTGQYPGVPLEGWTTYSFGGKNNNAFWANRAFDVEAFDRPLNSYVMPDETFYAPPVPQRLPANDPTRARQAPMFRDPADAASHQRNWPIATPTITSYDDVGSSYYFNIAWWGQLPQSMTFQARMAEGVRRIAAGEGVHPDRFVWMTDEHGDTIINQLNPNFRMTNGLGDTNWAPMLFLDGHAIYATVKATVYNTPQYAFRFE